MKKFSIVMAFIILLGSLLCGQVRADGAWSYDFVIDGMDVRITSETELSYEEAYRLALIFLYGFQTPPATHVLGHKYKNVTVTTITHNSYSDAPRCLERVYEVHICIECGYSERILLDSNRIYCCDALQNPFIDVKAGDWFAQAALWCYKRGYMAGTSENRFSPYAGLTRAMFVTILAKIDHADLRNYSGTSFADVPEGKWYSKPIQWAYRNGYTSGVGNGLFGVNDKVTREQLATFLYSYSKKKGYDVSRLADLSAYTDRGQISGWAVKAVRWAVCSGLISGTSKTTLSPKQNATRGQIAVTVKKYVENVIG